MLWLSILTLSCRTAEPDPAPAPTTETAPPASRLLLEPAHQPPARLLARAAGGIVEGSSDGSVRIRDLFSGLVVLHTEPTGAPVLDLYGRDGIALSAVPSAVRIHEPRTGTTRTLRNPGPPWTSAAFLGHELLVGVTEQGARRWAITADGLVQQETRAWSAPARQVWAAGPHGHVVAWLADDTVALLDPQGAPMAKLAVPRAPTAVYTRTDRHDAHTVLLVDETPTARLWTPTTGIVVELTVPADGARQVAGFISRVDQPGARATTLVQDPEGHTSVAQWWSATDPPLHDLTPVRGDLGAAMLGGWRDHHLVATTHGGVQRVSTGASTPGDRSSLVPHGTRWLRITDADLLADGHQLVVITEDGQRRTWEHPRGASVTLDPGADGSLVFRDPATNLERGRMLATEQADWLVLDPIGRHTTLPSGEPWPGADGWQVDFGSARLAELGPPHDGLLDELLGIVPATGPGRPLRERIADAQGRPWKNARFVHVPALEILDQPGGAPVATLPINTRVKVVDEVDGMVQVRPGDGPVGWAPPTALGSERLYLSDLRNYWQGTPEEQARSLAAAAALAHRERPDEELQIRIAHANALASNGSPAQAVEVASSISWGRTGVHLATAHDVGGRSLHLPFATVEHSSWLNRIDPLVAEALGLPEGGEVWLLPLEGEPYQGTLGTYGRSLGNCSDAAPYLSVQAPRGDFVAWTVGTPPRTWFESVPHANVAAAEAVVRSQFELPTHATVSAVVVDDGVRVRFDWPAPTDEPEHIVKVEVRDFLVRHDTVEALRTGPPVRVNGPEEGPRLVGSRDVDGDGRLDVIIDTRCWRRVERADGTEMSTIDICCYC